NENAESYWFLAVALLRIVPGLSEALSAVSAPPNPTEMKLKSFTRPEFWFVGLKEPPNSIECVPLVHVASSRYVGTSTKRSCELMPANGADKPAPKVKMFGNAGLKSRGKSNPERAAPTVT